MYDRTYEIFADGDQYYLRSTKALEEILECPNVEKALKYSRGDNKIIEIFEVKLQEGVSLTRYYPNFFPLFIIKQNDFYPNDTKSKLQDRYRALTSSVLRMQGMYDAVIDEIEAFIVHTGCYFRDFAGNNVIADESLDDFRILDVGSLMPYIAEREFSPCALFMSGKFGTERFDGDDTLKTFMQFSERGDEILRNVSKVRSRRIAIPKK